LSGLQKKRPKKAATIDPVEGKLPTAGEKYSGEISRQLAIEMLGHAIRNIERNDPPSSWPAGQKNLWYASIGSAVETLSRRRDSLRLNVRTVILPNRYPDDPGSPSRQYDYSTSLENAFEVIGEILDCAEQECGKEFRKALQQAIVRRFRRASL